MIDFETFFEAGKGKRAILTSSANLSVPLVRLDLSGSMEDFFGTAVRALSNERKPPISRFLVKMALR